MITPIELLQEQLQLTRMGIASATPETQQAALPYIRQLQEAINLLQNLETARTELSNPEFSRANRVVGLISIPTIWGGAPRQGLVQLRVTTPGTTPQLSIMPTNPADAPFTDAEAVTDAEPTTTD